MKNQLLRKLLIGLMMVGSTLEIVSADNSASVSVSCVIPVMPGINAPLIEEKTVKTADTTQEKPESQKETLEPTTAMIQEDQQEEKVTDEGQKLSVIVKTYYSR